MTANCDGKGFKPAGILTCVPAMLKKLSSATSGMISDFSSAPI
jgi:hypothetical protein